MLKYEAVHSITNDSLLNQFTRTSNALELEMKDGRFHFNDPDMKNFKASDNEVAALRALIEQQFVDANFWLRRGNLVHFEHFVSDPETTLKQLSVWPELTIKHERLQKSIDFMGKRSLESTFETDRSTILDAIIKSSGDEEFAGFVYTKQMEYLEFMN
jgi:hypothetical protein